MDPNLTLAHITHNTAVVLLHQSVAYTSASWAAPSGSGGLPSQSSADICLAAATEVATIARHFLGGSPFLANHQFAFCLFVCGRMLLAHAAYYQVPLMKAFGALVDSLREISNRWNGRFRNLTPRGDGSTSQDTNLASKFASRLSEARDVGPTYLDIRRAAYLDDNGVADAAGAGEPVRTAQNSMIEGNGGGGLAIVAPATSLEGEMMGAVDWDNINLSAAQMPASDASPDSISLAFPPLPQSFQELNAYQQNRILGTGTGIVGDTAAPYAGSGQGVHELEDISAYLDGTFFPDQRISMYSRMQSMNMQQNLWNEET